MDYPFVITDIDGTIVPKDSLDISQETIKSIKKYQDISGNKLLLASGKALPMIKKYIKQLSIKLPVITSNGAVVIKADTKEILYADYIKKSACIDLIKYAKENNFNIIIQTPTIIGGLEDNSRMKKFQEYGKNLDQDLKPDLVFFESFYNFIEGIEIERYRPVNISYSFDENEYEEYFDKVIERIHSLDLSYKVVYLNQKHIIVILNNGVSKWKAITKLAEIIDIEPKDIYTIGDNDNDFEMIKESNNGFAVSNANQNIKNVALNIIGSVESNGVGIFLEELVK